MKYSQGKNPNSRNGFKKRNKLALLRKTISGFKKGHTPWSKGKKIPEVSGENSPHWKGGKEHQKEKKKEWKQKNKEKVYFSNRKREMQKRASGVHTLGQWNDLRKKFNYMCLCCKQHEPEIKLTEDHIIPVSKGGSNNIENIQPLCLECNDRKFTKTTDYINKKTILL